MDRIASLIALMGGLVFIIFRRQFARLNVWLYTNAGYLDDSRHLELYRKGYLAVGVVLTAIGAAFLIIAYS